MNSKEIKLAPNTDISIPKDEMLVGDNLTRIHEIKGKRGNSH